MSDVNEVLYPGQLDTKDNFPDLDIVTQDSFVEINRNAEAIIKVEEILGVNPHIGIFTVDPLTATVAQRISVLESGMSSGIYRMNEINVSNALIVRKEAGVTDVYVGRNKNDTDGYGSDFGNVKTTIRGTSELLDICTFRDEVIIYSDKNKVVANSSVSTLGSRKVDPNTGVFDYTSILTQQNVENNAILTIQDNNPNFANDRNISPDDSLEHVALWVLGNVQIDGILRVGELALNHSALREIDTTPVINSSTDLGDTMTRYVHVKWGDWHSHVKRPGSFDSTSSDAHWEVETTVQNYGIIDHKDLTGIHTRTESQDTSSVIGFIPQPGLAYHVTGGDDHDHDPAGTMGGAQIDHRFLTNTGSDTGHITNGDLHNHTQGAGGSISHNNLTNRGFYTHTELDAFVKQGYQGADYLNQLVGGAQIDTYNVDGQLTIRKIFKDVDQTTLLEQHSFEYDDTNTFFIKTITRTLYDADFGSNLTKVVVYELTNDGTNYISMTWTPAIEA